jgi:hypothetical protein
MLAALAAAALASQFHVSVVSLPARPFVEQRGEDQVLNFDLLLRNDGQQPLRLAAIREQIFDRSDRLQTQREINGNGTGMLLVLDGHDLNSHHRRQNLASRFDRDPKTAANPNLYAYDFVRIGASGALFKGDPEHKENWFTFGAPVYAPVGGAVVLAVDGVPDNTFAGGQPVIPSAAQKIVDSASLRNAPKHRLVTF